MNRPPPPLIFSVVVPEGVIAARLVKELTVNATAPPIGIGVAELVAVTAVEVPRFTNATAVPTFDTISTEPEGSAI